MERITKGRNEKLRSGITVERKESSKEENTN